MSVSITKRIDKELEENKPRLYILMGMVKEEQGKEHNLLKPHESVKVSPNDSHGKFLVSLMKDDEIIQQVWANFIIDRTPTLTLETILDLHENVGSYTVPRHVTRQEIASAICNSFEGISGTWMAVDYTRDMEWSHKPKSTPRSEWATHIILNGGAIYIGDHEETNDPEMEWKRIDLQALIEGFRLNAFNRPHDADVLNGDAITADCIMQYSAFGEVVFG